MNNCYASVGFLGKSSDIELLERILLYNYETISKFNYIVVKNTCNPEMDVYYDAYNDIWKKTRQGASAAGGFSVDLLKDLAKGFIKKKISEHTGVEI